MMNVMTPIEEQLSLMCGLLGGCVLKSEEGRLLYVSGCVVSHLKVVDEMLGLIPDEEDFGKNVVPVMVGYDMLLTIVKWLEFHEEWGAFSWWDDIVEPDGDVFESDALYMGRLGMGADADVVDDDCFKRIDLLLELLRAADYLDVSRLTDVCCRLLAERMKNKSALELWTMLHIEDGDVD